MADDKYAKSKCFIFSPDGYEEITYSEMCRRRDTDIRYQERKFVPLHGMLMEVTPEQYADFYRTKNRQRYLDRRSAENGDISIDMLTTADFNGADILIDTAEPLDEQVIRKVMTDKLIATLSLLSEEEQELIHKLFYKGLTEREYAAKKGIYHNAVHKKKMRILEKLKKLLES